MLDQQVMPRSDGDSSDVAKCAMQGVVASQFELDKYKTQDKNGKLVKKLVGFDNFIKADLDTAVELAIN